MEEITHAIVTSYRAMYTPGDIRYSLISKNGIYNIISDRRIELYSVISASVDENLRAQDIVIIQNGDKQMAVEIANMHRAKINIDNNITALIKRHEKKPYWSITKEMISEMREQAAVLINAIINGSPILVRFHGDGDGACAALSLYMAIREICSNFNSDAPNIQWVLNKGIDYDMELLYSDASFFSMINSNERPILFITDFGSSNTSNEAISKATESYDILWHDHHPIPENFIGKKLKHYLNPLTHAGSADYTAGLLTSIFAELLGGIDTTNIREAALISDFSSYADMNNHDAVKIAHVIDFITGIKSYVNYLDGPITPKYLSKIVENKEQLEDIYKYGRSILDDALSIGIGRSKEYNWDQGINIHVFDFEYVAEKYSGYLLPGRYSSQLQSAFEKLDKNSTITIVGFINSISVRVSKAISSTLGLQEIIERIKREESFVTAGGGHPEAGSIRFESMYKEQAMRSLLKAIIEYKK